MNPTREEVERLDRLEALMIPGKHHVDGQLALELIAQVRSLLDENEAVRSANESVAVCTEHTVEIVEFEGCVICENERQVSRIAQMVTDLEVLRSEKKRQAAVVKEISNLLEHHIGDGIVCIDGENHYLSVLVAKALAGLEDDNLDALNRACIPYHLRAAGIKNDSGK